MAIQDPGSITPSPQPLPVTGTTAPAASTTAAPPTQQTIVSAADLAAKLGTLTAALQQTSPPSANVLNNVIELLMRITQTTQRLGVALANNLTFETNMQGVLTNLINSLPIYDIDKDGATLSGSGDKKDWISVVNLQNQNISVVSSRLSSYRDMSQDTSKKIQSSISQINDAQQAYNDLLTSIWDSQKQLLASLFR